MRQDGTARAETASAKSLSLQVEGFDRGGVIPRGLTCEGENRSPALHWSGAPTSAKSLALILDDPDAPGGVWNHWLVWNIPAVVSGLAESARLEVPVRSGTNDFGKRGYGGPCPPKGHGPHHYFFRLLALDVEELDLPEGARRAALDRALESHVVGTAEYMGLYERT